MSPVGKNCEKLRGAKIYNFQTVRDKTFRNFAFELKIKVSELERIIQVEYTETQTQILFKGNLTITVKT